MTIEKRLTETETKSAYQEKLLQDLSDVVYDQQQQIDKLTKKLDELISQLNELSNTVPQFSAPANEKPPHY